MRVNACLSLYVSSELVTCPGGPYLEEADIGPTATRSRIGDRKWIDGHLFDSCYEADLEFKSR